MSVAVKARMAGGAVRMAGYRLRERLTPSSRRLEPGDVPGSPDALTPEWLTEVLCGGHPGAAVTDLRIEPGSDGTSARRGLTVAYNDAGVAAGLPTALYTKSTPNLQTRLMCGLSGICVAEAGFYNLIRPGLDIETPHCYYAEYDLRDGRSMFILDDVVATRGAVFADPTDTHVDRGLAEHMVTLMATYHAAYWASPELDRLGWLRDSAQFQRDINESLNFAKMTRNGLARAEHVIPPEILHAAGDIWPLFLRSLELKIAGPLTLVHQDVHTRNWYVTADRRMGLYDWQALAKGSWAVDLAYALSSALTVADRRDWEQDLLRLYLDRLRAAGVDAPGWDDAWLRYRQQMMHGMVLWLGTIGLSGIHQQTQPREVCLAHLERMTQAAADLDALRLVAG